MGRCKVILLGIEPMIPRRALPHNKQLNAHWDQNIAFVMKEKKTLYLDSLNKINGWLIQVAIVIVKR